MFSGELRTKVSVLGEVIDKGKCSAQARSEAHGQTGRKAKDGFGRTIAPIPPVW